MVRKLQQSILPRTDLRMSVLWKTPDNVDKRRKEVGLNSIEDYAAEFGITWNVEEYKKMLPTYEKWAKEKD